jgi:predicted acyl esterase
MDPIISAKPDVEGGVKLPDGARLAYELYLPSLCSSGWGEQPASASISPKGRILVIMGAFATMVWHILAF